MKIYYRSSARCRWHGTCAVNALSGALINQPEIQRPEVNAKIQVKKEMNMLGVFLLIAGITVLGLSYMVAPIIRSTYRRYRGRRTIICPETDQIVEMKLKAGRAGVMAALGKQELRVKWCSLWPGR
ncbi:MAG TPA: hypothetical protein VF208_06015, partial [Candidatus Binatia bacterium]